VEALISGVIINILGVEIVKKHIEVVLPTVNFRNYETYKKTNTKNKDSSKTS
jgi:hypothetical protein